MQKLLGIQRPGWAAPRLAVLIALLSAGVGCDSKPVPPSWPAGTVVAIDDAPILAAEVDRFLDAMGAIDPAWSTTHRRRLALTSIAMPLTHGRHVGASEREVARLEAEAWNAERVSGSLVGPLEPPRSGNWEGIGIEVWAVARELGDGEWSQVTELAGRYVVVQLIARDGNPRAGHEHFEVQLKSFPYVERPEALLDQILEAELEIVDPEWDQVVPGFLKYEMRGES
jgi:hypothetical protein